MVRRAGWLAVALLLAGCNRRVEVPLSRSGATVACYGEDHVQLESDFSATGRNLCVQACRRSGFTPAAPVTDGGGLSPRLNPGTPSQCL